MKLIVLAVALLVCAMASANSSRQYNIEQEGPVLFEQFIKDYNKQYQDENDRQVHYQAFLRNLELINKLNKDNPTATFGINKFADYTEEESKHLFGGNYANRNSK